MRDKLILTAAIFLCGCATVTQGTRESLRVESEPAGALALTDIPSTESLYAIDGYLGCEPTPCAISIPRKAQPKITISLDGYQPITFKVSSSVATSATSVQTGALVAGLPPGSHVRAGSADFLKRIPVGGRVLAGAVMTYGVGAVVDVATGANRNLAPNPVTAFLTPSAKETQSNLSSADTP
ncbi:MAG: hypothetical protein AAF926_08570 [Pseudomonadota bacterium]